MDELYENIQDKDKRGRIMKNKCFVLHEEVKYVFHGFFYIPTIEKCNFILLMLGFLVQWNAVRLYIFFHDNALKNNINLKK